VAGTGGGETEQQKHGQQVLTREGEEVEMKKKKWNCLLRLSLVFKKCDGGFVNTHIYSYQAGSALMVPPLFHQLFHPGLNRGKCLGGIWRPCTSG